MTPVASSAAFFLNYVFLRSRKNQTDLSVSPCLLARFRVIGLDDHRLSFADLYLTTHCPSQGGPCCHSVRAEEPSRQVHDGDSPQLAVLLTHPVDARYTAAAVSESEGPGRGEIRALVLAAVRDAEARGATRPPGPSIEVRDWVCERERDLCYTL